MNTMPIAQAAGTAASLAVQGKCSVRDINIGTLQSLLKKNDTVLGFDQ